MGSCCITSTVVENATIKSNRDNLPKETQNQINNQSGQKQFENKDEKQISEQGINQVDASNKQKVPQMQEQTNKDNQKQISILDKPEIAKKKSQDSQGITSIEDKNQPKKPIYEKEIKIMLLGQGGVGKKSLLAQLKDKSEQGDNKELGFFKENRYTYEQQKFCIVGTPDFELEDDIDVREQRITQFQSYFDSCEMMIQAFLILVNFERTDLMKKKVMSVFKFMRKFQNKIMLAITHFDLSENKDEDQIHLKEKLKHLVNDERMMFLNNDDNTEVVRKKIYEKTRILLEKEKRAFNEQLNFKDTLFEKFDEQEQAKMLQQLNQAMGQYKQK